MLNARSNTGLDSLLHRQKPSVWQQFWTEPYLFLAKWIYDRRQVPPFQPASPPVVVVCIADTHNGQPEVPEGEILVHAGDATQSGTLQELQATIDWMHGLPHRHKILIAGNHDMLLDSNLDNRPNGGGVEARKAISMRSIIYLEKSGTLLHCSGGRQIQVYGNPWTPQHGNWAFQHPRTVNVWQDVIPSDTDILVTHGPPQGHLDIKGWGCRYLLDAVWKVRPALHVFGHLHDGHGVEVVTWDSRQRIFEEMVSSRGGIWHLLRLCFATLLARMRVEPTKPTLLVNAAVAAGIRDEATRKPIVVEI